MLEFINRYLIGAAVPILLILSGGYFLFKLEFFPITKFRTVSASLFKSKKKSFRPLALSLAGTLGVGNIVGVASAIYSGGFGAIFWMWASAVVAAILKYAEVVLAMRHRVAKSGGLRGGAPYYIKACLSGRFPRFSKLLAAFFAVLCVINCLSMGAMMQTNAISEAFFTSCGLSPFLCCALLAAASFFVIHGGAERITALTCALVPFMSIFYVSISLAVIIPRASLIPLLLKQIITSAFSLDSAAGGIFGFLLSRALRFGVMRGLFSNEAGCGTSPTAHISSEAMPCEQGFMGILEVLIDTVLLCTLTAFTVMLRYDSVSSLGESPMKMVLKAYSGGFIPKFEKAVELSMTLMVLCFGFATISCLSHYAMECLDFLSKKPVAKKLFAPVYCVTVLIGGRVSPALAWAVSDLTVGVMTLINLCILLSCQREICEETRIYFAKSKNICKSDNKFTKYS